jgi:hypothetical protein
MVEAWEKQDECKSKLLDWLKSYDVFICPVANKPAQPIDVEDGSGGGAASAMNGGWPYRRIQLHRLAGCRGPLWPLCGWQVTYWHSSGMCIMA